MTLVSLCLSVRCARSKRDARCAYLLDDHSSPTHIDTTGHNHTRTHVLDYISARTEDWLLFICHLSSICFAYNRWALLAYQRVPLRYYYLWFSFLLATWVLFACTVLLPVPNCFYRVHRCLFLRCFLCRCIAVRSET